MFKVFLISLVIVCCVAEPVNRVKRTVLFNRSVYGPQIYGYPLNGYPAVNYAQQALAVAPAVQPIVQEVREINPVHTFRTQHVLPLRELNGRVPIQVESTHLVPPPPEVTVTRQHEEPHRVVHEVIRPVIQEVREIIQPYRRLTQEIRPVQDSVHTDVATNAGPAVAAPAVVAPAVVAAPAPVQAVIERPGFGLIARPAPLYTGSYIRQFIDQLNRRYQSPLVSASEPEGVAVAPEAVVQQKLVPNGAHITRQYH